jgi:tryptophanyl-tRNA synthetase
VRDDPTRLAGLFDSYGALKAAVADTVVSTLRPLQERYADVAADPDYVTAVLREGAARARERAASTVRRVRDAFGLLPVPADAARPVR